VEPVTAEASGINEKKLKGVVKLSEYFVLLVVKTEPQSRTKEITKEHKEEH
jgi:hypothetical protein